GRAARRGGERGVERVDVERQVDAVTAAGRDLERPLGGPARAALPDLLEPDHGDPVLAAVVDLGARVHPAGDPDERDVLRIEAGVDGAGDRAAVVELLAADVDRRVQVRVDQNQ